MKLMGANTGAFLASTAAAFAQQGTEIYPSAEGTVDDNLFAMCVELTDSTPEDPKYFSGGAFIPMGAQLSDQQRNLVHIGLGGIFESIGANHSSEDVLNQDPELLAMVKRQVQTLERYYGTIMFGPNPVTGPVISDCPDEPGLNV